MKYKIILTIHSKVANSNSVHEGCDRFLLGQRLERSFAAEHVVLQVKTKR